MSTTFEEQSFDLLTKAHDNISQLWLGDTNVIDLLLSTVIASGHILIVDVPGVGKTTLAKGLAKILGLTFNRVQFTNDILPSDVLGGSVYSPNEGKFHFVQGPIFTDFLLADEINRASTRSQSAFLQAMEEGFVAVDGTNHPLSSLFTVIATQNPIDFDSTNPLPEAQLDRFLISINLGYPMLQSELFLLEEYNKTQDKEPDTILTKENVKELRNMCKEIYIHPDLANYIVQIARLTREETRIKLGISPRGSMHLCNAAKAYALVKGRKQVSPEDIQHLIYPVWGHRLLPRHGRDNDGTLSKSLLEEMVNKVPVPR